MNYKYIILEDSINYDWDDYGVFGIVLYNISTNEVVTNQYGHGIDIDRSDKIDLKYAIDNNIISIDELLKNILSKFPLRINETIEDIVCGSSINNPTAFKVNVKGGRKFHGEGYLIYAESTPVKYGLGAYHNEYNHYPVIVDSNTKTLNKINSFDYIEFDINKDDIREVIYNKIPHNIDTIKTLAHLWAYDMSYSACDRDNAINLSKKITRYAFNDIEIPQEVKDAIQIEKNRLEKIEDDKMNEKLPSIIEWVKKNTDKTTEEDILNLAKHIYHKYN